jgi:endoglycosylceramidase
MITKLGEAGIYTLIDAHQDVMARAICGEGMPNYYAKEIIANGTYCISELIDFILSPIYKQIGFCKPIDDYGWRKDKDGNPMIEDCQKTPFFNYYMSPESFTIFRELWTNKNGLQDKYVAYWDAVSKVLAKNKYVVGYDPTNEPLPSWTSAANALETIWPQSGHFDRYDL